MQKKILKGHEARLKIKKGIDIAADAVAPTLGPVGMTAFIEFPGLEPIECDDGVTILKNIELKDKYENMGVQSLRRGALRTSVDGGDGTATTTVLTQAFVHEAFKEIATDSSKIGEVRVRLNKGLEHAMLELTRLKRDVLPEDIEKIAAVSSLDSEVAKLIAEVIAEVGIDGVVTVEKSAKLGYAKDVVKGMQFDRGWQSPYFINTEGGKCELENAYVVLIDRRVNLNEQIIPILQSIGTGQSILLIADEIDGLALASLAQNAAQGVANICAVKNPFTGQESRDFLYDIAAMTGATVLSEENGIKLAEATKEQCGRIKRAIITKDKTTLVGVVQSEALDTRVKGLREAIANTVSEYQRGQLEDRLASLTGGVGVIRVGAYTDIEFNAKKYKFENAINATQAALQEGVVIGGGAALAKVAKVMGDSIFRRALVAPLRQMAINAGLDEHAVVLRVTTGKFEDAKDIEEQYGYDFKGGVYKDMFEAGIIDPFKVVRLALESAIAITRATVGMETAIVTEDESESKK